jgi:hypothetical protein
MGDTVLHDRRPEQRFRRVMSDNISEWHGEPGMLKVSVCAILVNLPPLGAGTR